MDKPKLAANSGALLALVMLTLLPVRTADALVPYTRPLWDMLFPGDDPFKILEHSPLSIPRAAAPEDSTLAVALARADWRETPAEHQISLDIPGMSKEDIKIQVEENRVLTISGERKKEEEVKDERWHRVERTVGKFWRQFRLPANADVENIRARLEAGVLRITVPKLAEEEMKKEPKVISIASSDDDEAAAAASGETVVTPGGGGRQEL